MPKDSEPKRKVMMEAHNSPYSIHPGSIKIHLGSKKNY